MGLGLDKLIKLGGKIISGVAGKNKQNTNAQYQTDQARANYETKRALEEEQDTRRMDGVDFLSAVAQGHGLNIPTTALAALQRRGAYKGTPADKAVLQVPKDGLGGVFFGALGDTISETGDDYGKAEMDRILKSNSATAGLTGRESLPGSVYQVDGVTSPANTAGSGSNGVNYNDDEILSYFQNLASLGGGPK
jgi:hypothetical protein